MKLSLLKNSMLQRYKNAQDRLIPRSDRLPFAHRPLIVVGSLPRLCCMFGAAHFALPAPARERILSDFDERLFDRAAMSVPFLELWTEPFRPDSDRPPFSRKGSLQRRCKRVPVTYGIDQ